MKDAKGHGSNTGTKGMRLVKTHVLGSHSAKVYKNPDWSENVVKTFRNGVYQPKNDYHTDDMSDAHATAQSQLNRWASQDSGGNKNDKLITGMQNKLAGDIAAGRMLASGPKSAPAPIHDSMDAGPTHDRAYAGAGPEPKSWSTPDFAREFAKRVK